MDKVKVAVRVRPFNRRELEMGTKCVVDMESGQTILHHPSDVDGQVSSRSSKSSKTFAFDHCFWSIEEENEKFASQEIVFDCLGKGVLQTAFEGYNTCIFAYGQTGSGKSYTMMGTAEQRGIIPRLCDTLFDDIARNEAADLSFKVEVSYMEIYNEKVRDLLDPNGRHNLRVREHNILGPYVDGLSTLAVTAFQEINSLMTEGNKSRTVAATNMNSESSRSHAVFNIIVTQTLTDLQTSISGEKKSKISLVDLAGSERAQKTGAVGARLKEGSSINKSLTTLGLVISALADQACGKARTKFVPYRDSTLTWLLKDNLGGNSKTVMVAAVSPAADNHEETLSTLRYADRAKRIVNHAVVNDDPNARVIRQLRGEVEDLRQRLSDAKSTQSDDLIDKLEVSEKLMKEMSKTWEEKLHETERVHQERTAVLEKMGISVQASGIRVEQGKYFLVNLNADPSLNELLVYYLKDHTLVGKPNAPTEQDIQLCGLGIAVEHCIIDIDNNDVFLTPLEGARTCVNGCSVTSQTKVKHGDRILWGNNHFFRINCPKANRGASDSPDENIDYDFAQNELMRRQLENDPIQESITALERQHVEDKQEALARQRLMYEQQMRQLRHQLTSPAGTPGAGLLPPHHAPTPGDPLAKFTPTSAGMQAQYQLWAAEREKLFRQSLCKLKEELLKASVLVREANVLAEEMEKKTKFSVTLQIPAANLSPNRMRGAFVSEPAILVQRRLSDGATSQQVWDMEHFENRIIDMRDLYEEWKERSPASKPSSDETLNDPFYEARENHNLIGVANVFLEALFHDVKLDYHVPIINQQGEVAGRLHIELCRVADCENGDAEPVALPRGGDAYPTRCGLAGGGYLDDDATSGPMALGSDIVCQVSIKEARGLPLALSNFVFCQYAFWGHPEPVGVAPLVSVPGGSERRTDGASFTFHHTERFTVPITEEFLEHCAEGALSIEVWGHQSAGFNSKPTVWEEEQVEAKSRSIVDRWVELTRKVELWVEVHELNDQGEYAPVEVTTSNDILTGGILQLRQGQSRRLLTQLRPVPDSGTLPLICDTIAAVSVGGVTARSRLQRPLDSYQEDGLTHLRRRWTDALDRRRGYLEAQLKLVVDSEERTEADVAREASLMDQWVGLTEECNAVQLPTPGSIIPGAPADWY